MPFEFFYLLGAIGAGTSAYSWTKKQKDINTFEKISFIGIISLFWPAFVAFEIMEFKNERS